MNLPKMILFDYGQTLIDEQIINPAAANAAVLACANNPNAVTAQEVQTLADALFKETRQNEAHLEVHEHFLMRYLYDYFEITFDRSFEEMEELFVTRFMEKAVPTPHVEELLEYLAQKGIRTGVISNISFSGACLERHINRLLPHNHFEFIVASSEYIFKKPHSRLFELALRKAKLSAREVWYCGNNVECDVEGAGNAGLFPVWYTGASDGIGDPCTDHLSIADWRELINHIECV